MGTESRPMGLECTPRVRAVTDRLLVRAGREFGNDVRHGPSA
jgi:hypothetical protein